MSAVAALSAEQDVDPRPLSRIEQIYGPQMSRPAMDCKGRALAALCGLHTQGKGNDKTMQALLQLASQIIVLEQRTQKVQP